MAYIDTKSRYHVALNGQGLLLQGAPNRMAYAQNQAPIYGNRFAQGDRTYADFTFWWFWTQTNWAAGYKYDKRWADDGKFLDSSGVNVILKPSSIILDYAQTLSNTILKDVTFNAAGGAFGTNVLVGRNNTDQKMLAVNAFDGSTIWQDTATGASERINCCGTFDESNLYLGCHTVGSGVSYIKKTTGDAATDVGTFTSGIPYAIVPYKDARQLVIFTVNGGVFIYDEAANTFTNKLAALPLGESGLNFSVGNLNGDGAVIIGARVYFTLHEINSYKSQLWAYDIGTNAYVHIWTFAAGADPMQLIEYNLNLYLFDNNNLTGRLSVWKYSPSISTVTTVGSMVRLGEIGRYGDTSTIIGNPIKDFQGVYFLVNNGTSNTYWQINENDYMWGSVTPPTYYSTLTTGILNSMSPSGGIYIVRNGASGTNRFDGYAQTPPNKFQTTGYLTSSVFDGNIPGFDKLFYQLVLNFDPLVSGQSIEVQYCTDQNVSASSTFTSLGTASFSADGAISSKDFYWSGQLISKFMTIKIILNGNGNNTPSVNDYSVKYIPFVNYTKLWNITVNCGDEVKGLDGQPIGKPGREIKNMLEAAWWAKSILDYQDLDFAQTVLTADVAAGDTTINVKNADDFPEQGRIRIDSEEILYTGKTATTFTGCTRGARETRAVTHNGTSAPATVSNAYRVIITELEGRVPIELEDKRLEYTVTLSLREA